MNFFLTAGYRITKNDFFVALDSLAASQTKSSWPIYFIRQLLFNEIKDDKHITLKSQRVFEERALHQFLNQEDLKGISEKTIDPEIKMMIFSYITGRDRSFSSYN